MKDDMTFVDNSEILEDLASKYSKHDKRTEYIRMLLTMASAAKVHEG
jgi:hypothetical protein